MAKTIKNEEVKVTKSTTMNDMDYIQAVLSNEKAMAKAYATVTTEMSNENLFKTASKLLNDTLKEAHHTFEVLFQNGWYKLETADDTKINQTATEYEKRFNDEV